MRKYALKMLIGDKAKYIGMILGLSFSTFIMAQQAAIFVGLMTRTFGFITDTSQANIWVMDPKVQYIDDTKPMREVELLRVIGTHGVEWAVPFFKGLIRARLEGGNFQTCVLIGIDDATLIGGPPKMVAGSIENLKIPDAIIVNEVGAKTRLSHDFPIGDRPLQIGDRLELNDHRAIVEGICSVSRTFQSQPVIYTTFKRAFTFSPKERKTLSFILAKSKPGYDPKKVCERIEQITGLKAYTASQFKRKTVLYFLKYTGIPINFGVAVLLGFIIGTAIAGQTFYNFTIDNIRYFATFKAMGASDKVLTKMVLFQAFWVGMIGGGIGLGSASLFGFISMGTELSFRLPWALFALTCLSVGLISMMAAFLSLKKVKKLDPSIVFKG